ncbi:MAG TPA: NAD-dependent epimerase/dehydratase family protein, partial [Kutzneria sp.]
RKGTGRIVYVSTFGALLPTDQPVLGTDAPVGTATEPYLASKAAGEVIARRHQDQGVPVVISYPPGLLGPHDPNLGDQNRRLRDLLRGLMPMWPRGGFPIGDVRDTAALHAALLTEPVNHNRVFAPGQYLTTQDYVRTVRAVTGRALPAVFLPARPMLPLGRMAGVLQRFWPWHIPAEYGAIYTCATAVPVDATAAPQREFADTVADTVRWLLATGQVSARAAGRALLSEMDSRVVSDQGGQPHR